MANIAGSTKPKKTKSKEQRTDRQTDRRQNPTQPTNQQKNIMDIHHLSLADTKTYLKSLAEFFTAFDCGSDIVNLAHKCQALPTTIEREEFLRQPFEVVGRAPVPLTAFTNFEAFLVMHLFTEAKGIASNQFGQRDPRTKLIDIMHAFFMDRQRIEELFNSSVFGGFPIHDGRNDGAGENSPRVIINRLIDEFFTQNPKRLLMRTRGMKYGVIWKPIHEAYSHEYFQDILA